MSSVIFPIKEKPFLHISWLRSPITKPPEYKCKWQLCSWSAATRWCQKPTFLILSWSLFPHSLKFLIKMPSDYAKKKAAKKKEAAKIKGGKKATQKNEEESNDDPTTQNGTSNGDAGENGTSEASTYEGNSYFLELFRNAFYPSFSLQRSFVEDLTRRLDLQLKPGLALVSWASTPCPETSRLTTFQ